MSQSQSSILPPEISAGQVLWWLAVDVSQPASQSVDQPGKRQGPRPVTPTPFNYFREVLEHDRARLCAETDDHRILNEEADIVSADGRVYAKLSNGEYYELTVNGWVSNRMIQCVNHVPGRQLYEVNLPRAADFGEDDRIVVIGGQQNPGDPPRGFTAHGVWREFYRPMEQSPYQ